MGALCLGFSLKSAHSQDKEEYLSHPDTLRIDLPNGQNIELSFMNIKESAFDEGFIDNWHKSIKNIQALVAMNRYNQPVRIRLVNKEVENELKDVVEIEELSKGRSVYMNSNGVLQDLAKFNIVQLEYNEIKIKIRLVELSYLAELGKLDLKILQDKLAAKKEEVHFDNRKAFYLRTKLKNNSFTDFTINDKGVADFVNLSAGLGVGFFRDKLAPEISLNMSFVFTNKHGVFNRKFGLQSSFFYLFDRKTDGSYDMDINTFLTGYYMINTSKSTLKDRWTGVGLGYLIDGNGGYFGDNTFKLSLLFMSDNKGLDIMPELVITDDFKTVFPSLRLGFTF